MAENELWKCVFAAILFECNLQKASVKHFELRSAGHSLTSSKSFQGQKDENCINAHIVSVITTLQRSKITILVRVWYLTVSQQWGNGAATVPVYVEQGEIKGRFMSIIMNPMPALITTILDSLKCAVAAGNHLPCVLVLYTEHINTDQVSHLHVGGDFLK